MERSGSSSQERDSSDVEIPESDSGKKLFLWIGSDAAVPRGSSAILHANKMYLARSANLKSVAREPRLFAQRSREWRRIRSRGTSIVLIAGPGAVSEGSRTRHGRWHCRARITVTIPCLRRARRNGRQMDGRVLGEAMLGNRKARTRSGGLRRCISICGDATRTGDS